MDRSDSWITGKIDDLFSLIRGPQGIDAKSPSKRAAREVGVPIGQGIIAGMRASLDSDPIAGIVGEWAKAGIGGGFVAKLLTPLFSNAMGRPSGRRCKSRAAVARQSLSTVARDGRRGITCRAAPASASRAAWARSRTMVASAPMRSTAGAADCLRHSRRITGRCCMAKWGVPTEASCQQGVGAVGDRDPAVVAGHLQPPARRIGGPAGRAEGTAPAMEAGAALEHLAKAAADVADALKAVPVRFALEVERAAGIIGKAIGGLDDLIPRMGGSDPGTRPLPPVVWAGQWLSTRPAARPPSAAAAADTVALRSPRRPSTLPAPSTLASQTAGSGWQQAKPRQLSWLMR